MNLSFHLREGLEPQNVGFEPTFRHCTDHSDFYRTASRQVQALLGAWNSAFSCKDLFSYTNESLINGTTLYSSKCYKNQARKQSKQGKKQEVEKKFKECLQKS